MHRFYLYCAQLIGGMIVCLLIISFSVTLTLNFRPLYYADIQHLHIAELSGRNEEDIRQNYDALIDYNSLFNHEPLKFPTCTMSESGRSHFEEVKKIFDLFGWTLIINIWSDIDRYSPICPKERMALASDRGDFVYCAAGVSWYHGCGELGVCICDFSSACF